MALKFTLGAALGSWKEWARLFCAELERFDSVADKLDLKLETRTRELYEALHAQMTATRTLIGESEERDQDALQLFRESMDTLRGEIMEEFKTAQAESKQYAIDIAVIKTQATISGALAGTVPALAVILFELLKK